MSELSKLIIKDHCKMTASIYELYLLYTRWSKKEIPQSEWYPAHKSPSIVPKREYFRDLPNIEY